MSNNPSGGSATAASSSNECQGLGLLRLIATVILFALVLPSSASAAAPPIADFSVNPRIGCATPHTVFFTDLSTSVDSWAWDFGDGNTSTAQNPIYTYSSPDDYQVTLTATNAFGSDDATETISISVPSASFNATTTFGCGPLETRFTDGSTSDASLTSWSWDFGDGTSSTERNPIHTYDDPGVYNVALTVTDANSCSDTEARSSFIQVIGPKPGFSADVQSGDVPLEVTFTDETISGAPIISWNWDLGDGAMSSLLNPSHTYSTAGAFDVSLTVQDLDGCSRALSKPSFVTTTANADLQISVDDGVSEAVPGESVTYTIAIRNEGATNDPAAVVSDVFPASLACSWTSVAAGGATGNIDGSGDLSNTLALPSGSVVTYTATCDIDPAVTGNLSNTGTITSSVTDPNPLNNSSTDDDTLLTPTADHSVSVSTSLAGASITYTIVAAGAGPSTDSGALVSHSFPVAVTGVSWTCVASPGSACAAAGPGDILETVTLSPGGNVTFTATGTLPEDFNGDLNHTASIQPGPGVVDPRSANNVASGTTVVAPPPPPVTVTVTTTETDPTNASPIPVTIIFSEEVIGFAVGDLSLGNGTVSNFVTSDNTTFTADITPSADGAVAVDVAAAVAQGLAGNDNIAATQLSLDYDGTAPTVTVASLVTTDSTPPLTGTVDEDDATLEVTVDGQTVTATNNSDGTWTLADNALPALANGTYDVSVTATDPAGNTGSDATADELTVTPDTDGDGIDDAIENAGPNDGDGNNDGTPDANQPHVASLPTAAGRGYMTVEASGACTALQQVAAVAAASLPADPAGNPYPFGLVEFRLPCETASVKVVYHSAGTGEFANSTYRKYGPVTPGDASTTDWYDFSDYATLTENTWTLDLADNRLGDDTGDDGVIVDQGGPASGPVLSVPIAQPWALLLMMLTSLFLAHRYLPRAS